MNFLISSYLYSLPVTVNGSMTSDYSDLTSAFNAINLGTHGSGAITVLINQSHTIISSAVLNGGVFTNCIIKPAADVTVDGNFSNALVILDGADRVTIDGRIGIINNIRLSLSNAGGSCIEMKNGATDNVIKFVQDNSGINITQSLPGTGGNNNNSIEDCNTGGILSRGTGGTSGFTNGGTKILRNITGLIILSNETRDNEINNNKCMAILLQGVGINNIAGNVIYPRGISIFPENLTAPGSSITEINAVNNFVTVNVVLICISCMHKVYGISIEPALSGINNFTANIFNNTVFVNVIVGMDDGFISSGIYADLSPVCNLNLKNNLVFNTYGNDPDWGDTYGSYIKTTGDNVNADYNCYLNLGASGGITSCHARWNFTGTTDIDEYKAAVYPNEQHTVFKSASFVDALNAGNLHLAGSSVGDIDLAGIQIPGITTDIDDQPRSPVHPYKGADEVTDFPLPVKLASFTSFVNNNNVNLKWTTASETNNSGFDVERSNVKGQTSNEWTKISFVQGHGTTVSPNNYEFIDRNLASGKYSYRLKQLDFNGNYEYHNLSDKVVIGVPEKFELSQNYPNPFNPVTNLEFEISDLEFVSLIVYDIEGKEVMTLVNETKPAGRYQVKFNGSNLGSGIYFYKIEAGSFSAVKKMTIIK